MQRIPAIEPEDAAAEAGTILERIRRTTGMVSNQMKTLALAPAALRAYFDFDKALADGILSYRDRERIALTVAQASGCDYSLAVHCTLGRLAGLSEEEIQDSRRGISPDRRLEAMLQFARQVVVRQGRVSDADLARLNRLGCGHEEMVEILANVMLALFSSYFNFIAGTERDFPGAPELAILENHGQPPASPAQETITLS